MRYKKRNVEIVIIFLIALIPFRNYSQKSQNHIISTGDFHLQKLDDDGGMISPNGDWITWTVNYDKHRDSLYVKNPFSGKNYSFPFSAKWDEKPVWLENPTFSQNGKWYTYPLAIVRGTGYLNLISGKKIEIKNAIHPSFSRDGNYLAVELNSENNSDLQIINLNDHSVRIIPNIMPNAWSFNYTGKRLAYITEDSTSRVKKIEILDSLKERPIKVIEVDKSEIQDFSWSKNGDTLLFLITNSNEGQNFFKDYAAIYKYNCSTRKLKVDSIIVKELEEIPKGMVATSFSLEYDNKVLIKFSKKTEVVKKNDSSSYKNPKALRIRKSLNSSQSFIQYLGIYDWRLKKMMLIEYPFGSELKFSAKGNYALLFEDNRYTPYFKDKYVDYYLIDFKTGLRTLLLEKYRADLGSSSSRNKDLLYFSPDEQYLVYYKDKQWWSYHLRTKQHTCFTKNISANFENINYDRPGIKPPYGCAGWTEDSKEIFIYDQFNVYAFQPGSNRVKKITNGEVEKKIFRIQLPNINGYRGWGGIGLTTPVINTSLPIILSAEGIKDKYNGYYQWYKGALTKLVYENAKLGEVGKAIGAFVYSYVKERLSEPPSLIVTKPGESPIVVWKSSSQPEGSFIGESKLVNFTSRSGQNLQGALYYPANYQRGKKYPLIVVVYERHSQKINQYVPPDAENNNYLSQYLLNGYFVFCPDIVFKINAPGFSAVDCVIPAVEKVIATGMIDKDKIGLTGGSWGGYLTTFIISQTNLFKAAIASAPITDFISMSLSDRIGDPLFLFEGFQGRMAGPYYEETEAYLRNSTIHHVKTINTPLLLIHGTNDQQVDWHQSMHLEYAMCRAQKPCIFLKYEGENHGITKNPENKADCFRKKMEYFGHYLKGEAKADWMK